MKKDNMKIYNSDEVRKLALSLFSGNYGLNLHAKTGMLYLLKKNNCQDIIDRIYEKDGRYFLKEDK